MESSSNPSTRGNRGTRTTRGNRGSSQPNQPQFSQFSTNEAGFSQFSNFNSGFSQFGGGEDYTPIRDFQLVDEQMDQEFDPFFGPDHPETQEQQQQHTKAKPKPKPWTPLEEMALAKAWILTSEDPYRGNNQQFSGFWRKILAEFNEQLGYESGRTFHQCNSKWKDLNANVSCFGGIFNNLKSGWGSGRNDADILRKAQTDYMKTMKTKLAFNHFGAWDVLKESPKWCGVKTFEEIEESSSKKSKTSDSTVPSFQEESAHFDLNNEEEEPARPRPPPRRKGKNPVESSSTEREELMKMVAEFHAYSKDDVEDKKQHREEKRKLKERKAEARILRDQKAAAVLDYQQEQMIEDRKNKDLEFLLKPHDHLSGSLLQNVLARKQEIASRWG